MINLGFGLWIWTLRCCCCCCSASQLISSDGRQSRKDTVEACLILQHGPLNSGSGSCLTKRCGVFCIHRITSPLMVHTDFKTMGAGVTSWAITLRARLIHRICICHVTKKPLQEQQRTHPTKLHREGKNNLEEDFHKGSNVLKPFLKYLQLDYKILIGSDVNTVNLNTRAQCHIYL